MEPTIAYLAQGRLFLKAPDRPARLIESQFAQQMVERAVRSRQRNEWKGKGPGAGFLGAGMLWGLDGEGDPTARRIHISGVARGAAAGELIYTLDTDHVGGVFAFDPAENHERRLSHRSHFRARDLARHPKRGLIACSVESEHGTSNLALMEPDGTRLREITEGDSLDQAPAWVPPRTGASGDAQQLVYQSAGLARNPRGLIVERGPYAVQWLDLDRGELDTLLEDARTDFLVPRVDGEGSLYFIRRPYKPSAGQASPLRTAADVLLFPLRLLRALVAYFNFFSMRYTGKPLTTAGGPKMDGPDAKEMMLWGNLVHAERAMRERRGEGEHKSLVPATWQLVRRRGDGGEEVLAKGVLSFDLLADGTVVYTNGSAVFHLDGAGERREICAGKMIHQVVALERAAPPATPAPS